MIACFSACKDPFRNEQRTAEHAAGARVWFQHEWAGFNDPAQIR